MWHEYHTILLAERWQWTPETVEGMPISVRRRYVDAIVEIVAKESRKARGEES